MLAQMCRIPTTALLVAAILCGAAQAAHAQAAPERDSAGVSLVHLSEGVPISRWRLAGQPLLEIGAEGGNPGELLHAVQGASLLSHGGFVVALGAPSPELRYFGAAGAPLRRVGRSGEGPGEFGTISAVFTTFGDSVVVYDPQLSRLSLFSPDAELIRTQRVQAPGLQLQGILPDGSMLMVARLGSERQRDDFNLDRFGVLHVSASGTVIDTLDIALAGGSLDIDVPGMGRERFEVPFGLNGQVLAAPSGEFVQVVRPDRGELRVYTVSGSPVRFVRGPLLAPVIGPASVSRAFEDLQASQPQSAAFRQMVQALRQATPVPLQQPPAVWMRTDMEGRVWIERFRWPGAEQASWLVFRVDGQLLATLETPANVRVLDADAERIVVLWLDDLGVESIRVYRAPR